MAIWSPILALYTKIGDKMSQKALGIWGHFCLKIFKHGSDLGLFLDAKTRYMLKIEVFPLHGEDWRPK